MRAAEGPPPSAVAFGAAVPVLRVRSLDVGIDHYVRALGFVLEWREDDTFACVTRDGCRLFLAQGDQGQGGSWLWIGVRDAEALHHELRARGVAIRQPPTNFAWALELQVEDPDGNVLRLGSDPKPDVPFGPWLDMRGERWMPAPEGGWSHLEAPQEPAGADAPNAVDAPVASATDALTHAHALRSRAVREQEHGGEPPLSRRYWEEACRLYEQAAVKEGVAESAAWSARLAWRMGDLARAREWLAAARAASDASDDPETWKFVRTVGLELGG